MSPLLTSVSVCAKSAMTIKNLSVIVLLGALLISGTSAHAGTGSDTGKRWRFGGWIGGASVNLHAIEDDARLSAEFLANDFVAAYGGTARPEIHRDHGAGVIGIEIGYLTDGASGLGIKIGLVDPTEITGEVIGDGGSGESLRAFWTLETDMTAVLFGGWMQGGRPVGFHYRGSLYWGPAFGVADETFSVSTFTPPFSTDFSAFIPYAGSTFAVEISGGCGYGLSRTLSLYVEMALLMAKIQKMEAEENVDVDGDGIDDVRKGDAFSDDSGNTLAFDFSGVQGKFGIRLSF